MPQNIGTFYTGSGFSDWEIGDITVLIFNGKYHLFHLIIPNHDYIAHAVSNDGINWYRVKNALFVGDPGKWDDDMLWTMHVVQTEDRFEMYYTGLQRRDRGINSRIGLAVSKDLYHWEKVENEVFPFGSAGPHYEDMQQNSRGWLSFRDPFRYDYDGEKYFLICARQAEGYDSRRGCVGLVKWNDTQVEYLPPLHYPMVYDDVECPCAFELGGRHYLLGSIREDIKVRYWFADSFKGEYHCFHNNVLLPMGNYAARTLQDGNHLLVYTFFYTYGSINSMRILPPPKELDTDETGRLVLRTYYRWQKLVRKTENNLENLPWGRILNNKTASLQTVEDGMEFQSRSGNDGGRHG